MKRTQALTTVIHIIGWLLFLCIPVFFVSQNELTNYPMLSLRILLFSLYYIFFFYVNTRQLIPRFYLRKKQVTYFSVIAGLLIVTIFAKPFDRLIANNQRHPDRSELSGRNADDRQHRDLDYGRSEAPLSDFDGPGDSVSPRERPEMPPPKKMIFDIISIVLFLLVWAVGYALKLVSIWKDTETRMAKAEAERARAELIFLKARINPHFLFNTLNNIYSMALAGHDQTANSILRLSNIMRYITDDVVNDYVLLENELLCIDNYIDLQKLRLNRNTPVTYQVSGNSDSKFIAPLILMPFVENVFKYGISNHQLSPITISIEIADDSLYFFASNRVVPPQITTERSGIGISNTRQRLALLYPDRHHLLIKSTEEMYAVQLTIYF